MIFKRKIYKHLKEHLLKRQITAITGMRRTGKSTLVKELLSEISGQNKIYFDLEQVSNRHLFSENNYENIVRALVQRGLNFEKNLTIAIDEIQLVPNIPSVLKYIYDHYKCKFIVSGSNSYYIKNLFSESLSGRKKIFELFPLDFGEFLTFKNVPFVENEFGKTKFSTHEYERIKSYYEEFIEFGGFPEIALEENNESKTDLLSDILNSYILIDIKFLSDFRNEQNIFSLIKMLGSRLGTRLDYSKLSRLTGISRVTVQNYIDLFEKTYLLTRVPVYSKNTDREIVKAQKLYFNDTGLATVLGKPSSGALFENAVFNQLKHKGRIKYYSLKNGKELDFILDEKIAVEVKETPTEFDLKIVSEMALKIGIKKTYLVGRNRVKGFSNYLWGGEIN